MGQTERFLALREQDAKTRTLAVTEFSRPLLVEAGAGTGKTALLVARILAWSLGPGWEQAEAEAEGLPQDIAGRVASGVVAITFTEKAAAEMGTRLAEGLATVLAGKLPHGLELAQLPELEVCRERSRALLSVLDRYVLCTIHAFGLRLLARYPLEAGLTPGFKVDAEGFGVARVVEDVVADFLANPDPSLVAPWQVLGFRQIGPEELTEALVAAVQQGLSSEALGTFPLEEQLEWLARELKEKLGQLAEAIAPLAQEKRLKKARELWELASTWASHAGSTEEFLQQLVSELDAKGVVSKLNEWGRGKFAQTEVSVLAENASAVQMLALWVVSLWKAALLSEPQTLRAFLSLGESFLTEIDKRLREAGLVTYQDLLTGSVRLLSENPHVASRERTRIKQLLVDEFQDTDRWQGRLVSLLALADEDPKPGLFLVGDPKQSIYGWRSADLAVYHAFKEKVKKAGGEVCPLVVNFRSVPVILEEVERVVKPVMKEEPGMQPAFQELVPFRSRPEDTGFGQGKHHPVEYWVCWEFIGKSPNRKTRMADARELEANALAHHIFELHELYGVSYSHMAVLLRAFSDADVYLEALRQHGVPYATTHDPTYFQRREVLDAFCLLQAVADPEDELALVGFLRSAWAGIPDAAWWELKKRGFFPLVRELYGVDGERLSQLQEMLSEVARELSTLMPGKDRIRGWEQTALWALVCLGVLRQSFHQDPADVFVARVQFWLLPEATEAARFPGRVRVSNLQRFFRYLLQGLPSFPTPKELVHALRRAVEEAQREGGSRPPEAEDAVLVTTIHQAKGLDFPFVFLADVARGSRGNRGPVAGAWWLGSGESSADLVLKVGKLATPNIVHLWAWQEQVAEAEAVRLLYVALTRAKERLVISGHWPEQPASQALVGLLRSREDLPDLEALAAKLDGNDRVEAGGVLWVFPGAVQLPEVTAQREQPAA
ncbi:MAG: UvrD-helicase domain-containing protein, partial [Thermoanaerobaculum sp.]